MTFEEYHERAMRLARYPDIGNNMEYPAIGLAGEVGEYCDKLKKVIRDFAGDARPLRYAMLKELGDALWYISACAFEIGFTLNDVAVENIEKLDGRNERGTLQGSGDDR